MSRNLMFNYLMSSLFLHHFFVKIASRWQVSKDIFYEVAVMKRKILLKFYWLPSEDLLRSGTIVHVMESHVWLSDELLRWVRYGYEQKASSQISTGALLKGRVTKTCGFTWVPHGVLRSRTKVPWYYFGFCLYGDNHTPWFGVTPILNLFCAMGQLHTELYLFSLSG